MKGIQKYVNDLTKEKSVQLVGVEYYALISNKMKKNNFLIKYDSRRIHFNEIVCNQFRYEKEKLNELIDTALMSIMSK
jgi:hypothetical protein